MTTQKSDLTAAGRGKKASGGSLVRLSPTFIAAQKARDLTLYAALGMTADEVAPKNRYDETTAFVVVDLCARKTYDRPAHIAVSPSRESGIAFGVALADIVEVLA